VIARRFKLLKLTLEFPTGSLPTFQFFVKYLSTKK